MLKRASDNNRVSPYNSDTREVATDASGVLGGLDLRELFRIARRRGPLVAMLGFIAALLGAVYALQLTPIYSARATLLIDPKGPDILGSQSVVSDIGNQFQAIESEIELIKSYDVAKRVVEKLKLDEQTQALPTQPSMVRQIIGLVLSREKAPEPEIIRDIKDGKIRGVQNSVSVARRGYTYVIDISYSSANPALAAQIANAFADEYLVDQLESRFEATRRANDWLNERLGALKIKVRDSERAVELFKVENNIVETAGTTLTDQQVSSLNEQLILARAEAAQAQAKYQQIQAVRKRGGDVTAFAGALQSGALAALKGKASEVRRELATLTSKYGDRHPSVVAAKAQLSDVNRSIGSETQRVLTTTENELRVAGSRVASIEKSLNEIKGTAAVDNQAEVTLRELEREAAANKALFESFLSRFKQTGEQKTLETSKSRVIERAATPTSPSAPNKKLIVLVAAVLGLGLGAGIAFLLEQLDAGFRTSAQVEKLFSTPVLASVPRSDNEVGSGRIGKAIRWFNPLNWLSHVVGRKDQNDRRMARADRVMMSTLAVSKPMSSFTESIRSLRMGIRFADVDQQQKIILVTSALPGEGKSTIASNLAQLSARSGEKVLLIDLDLRHPVLTSLYAPGAKAGTVELLLGEVSDVRQLIIKDPASGLHILPSPRRSDLSHTAELLGSQRLKDLLAHLSEHYDLIVVDTSPLLPVTDGRALISAVDGLALVIKWEKTPREAVETALKQSLGSQDKLTGVVLNDVVASKARYYDYYKSGYYTKQYPYYYGGSK